MNVIYKKGCTSAHGSDLNAGGFIEFNILTE